MSNINKKRYKYPKTFHLPWSPGLQNDDRLLKSTENFIDKEVVVTVKLDGENTSIYSDHIHARSLDSVYHKSRSWVFKLQNDIGYLLKSRERICGENISAKHSIHYKNMEDYFYTFSYWIDDVCQNWDDTVAKTNYLRLNRVPTLYRGVWNENVIKSIYKQYYDGNEMEGYVVRLSKSFHLDEFQASVAKYVRKGHIQTDKNWMQQPVVWNGWNRK